MRDVRESPLFAQQRAALRLDIRRLDEAMLALTEAVHISAEVYPLVPGTTWRWAPVRGGHPVGSDPLRVYFEIVDDTLVELMYIERVLEDPDDPVKW